MRRSHRIIGMQGEVKNWGMNAISLPHYIQRFCLQDGSQYHTTFRGFAYRMVANITPQGWATEDTAAASNEHLMP